MTTDPQTPSPTPTDRLIDALHGHFMLDAVGPIGCECPKASDEEHVAEFVLAHLAAQEPTDAEKDAAMDALGCELRVVENGQSTCDLHGGYATSDDVCEVVEVALAAARAVRQEKR